VKKEAEQFLKYKDLATESQRMRELKTKAIPVINGHMLQSQTNRQRSSET
jgi:hypothetical protein